MGHTTGIASRRRSMATALAGAALCTGLVVGAGQSPAAAGIPNTPPMAVSDSFGTIRDVPITVPAPGVLANDTDADGGTLTVISFTQPPGGASVTVNPDGSFTFTPAPGLTGSTSFTYTVSDGQGGTAVGIVSITIDPDPTECNGELGTIVGTDGNDTLVGTAGRDVITALGGNDTITGLRGDDVICGGEGNDTIDGGVGDDYIEGGAGNDHILGRAGNDFIAGDAGDDNIGGGDGDDFIVDYDGNDKIRGNAGNDGLFAGSGDDLVIGGLGDDSIFGEDGFDTCNPPDATQIGGDDLVIDCEAGTLPPPPA